MSASEHTCYTGSRPPVDHRRVVSVLGPGEIGWGRRTKVEPSLERHDESDFGNTVTQEVDSSGFL